MKNIIFIAPPAAGKGTYSKLIKDNYHIPHISTGDLLRDKVKENSEEGKEIKAIMQSGKLVGDNIITKLLEERLTQSDCQNGYILDGYPRNIDQAKAYEELLQKIGQSLGIVIYLEVDKQEALDRVLGRVVCSQCGATFNTKINKFQPKQEGICDHCHHPLEARVDDNEETFLNRFNEYLNKTEDLINYYEQKGVLHKIKSQNNDTPEIMLERIKKLISND